MKDISYSTLYDLYIIKGLGSSTIAEYFKCSPSTIQTKLKQFNIPIRTHSEASKLSAEKVKETCIKRYGGIGYASQSLREKSQQTCFKLYGNSHYTNIEKIKNTNLLKYGVKSTLEVKEFRTKALKTLYNNYGVSCALDVPGARQKSRDKESLQKEYITKKSHNSFNKSKKEEQFFEYLKLLYNVDDIERQYSIDPRYPFNCDFYIKSEDLFIECNYHWTHGGKPFDKDDINCQQQLLN